MSESDSFLIVRIAAPGEFDSRVSNRAILREMPPVLRPRLRRVPAYSDLGKPACCRSPRAPATPLKVSWPSESGDPADTRSTLTGHEDEDFVDRRPFGSSAFASTYGSPKVPQKLQCARSQLHRKRTMQDLRSLYAVAPNPELDMVGVHLIGGDGPFSPGSGHDSDSTVSPSKSVTSHPQEVFCISRKTVNPADGRMTACEACRKWFHLKCVGHGHDAAEYFGKRLFICPGCEAIAIREGAEEI